MAEESLYEVLGLAKTATQQEIKKAYHQLALRLHPDKCGKHDEETRSKFQLLQKVYSILGDVEKRKVYDETGATDDDALAKFGGLAEYFGAKLSDDDIESFADRYKGSDEERSDLLRFYNQFSGNMVKVFDWLMCSDPDHDSHRLMDTVDDAIKAGELQRTKAYTAWAKATAAKPRPKPRDRKAGGSDARSGIGSAGPSNALVAAIQAKVAAADSFFDSLLAKYAGGSSAGRRKQAGQEQADGLKKGSRAAKAAAAAEPTDEEFAAAQARITAGKGATTATVAAAANSKPSKRKQQHVETDDEEEASKRHDSKASKQARTNTAAGPGGNGASGVKPSSKVQAGRQEHDQAKAALSGGGNADAAGAAAKRGDKAGDVPQGRKAKAEKENAAQGSKGKKRPRAVVA